MDVEKNVEVSTEGYVCTVQLKRPESLNSFNRAMRLQLNDALKAACSDSGVRVIVLAGSGRGFSSGTDLNEGALPGQSIEDVLIDEYWPSLKLIEETEKTVIAANPGIAAGIGCSYVAHSDLSVMSEDGQMILAFTNVGLVPDGGLSRYLLGRLGYQMAYELVATGGKLSAKECLSYGLVSRLAPANEVLSVAQSWAKEIALRPPLALKESKKLLRAAYLEPYEELVRADAQAQDYCMASEDSKEAVAAFKEKRAPVFKGC